MLSLIINLCLFFCVYQPCFGANEITIYAENVPIKKCNNSQCYDAQLSIEENEKLNVNIETLKHIKHAWCDNNNTFSSFLLKIDRLDIFTDMKGDDETEGKWNCFFLYNKDISPTQVEKSKLKYYKNHTYLYLECTFNIQVKRSMTLTVSSTGQSVEAKTDKITYFYYKEGENITAECKKDSHSENLGVIQMKVYFNEKGNLNEHTVKETKTKRVLPSPVVIIPKINEYKVTCTYISPKDVYSTAQVIIKFKPDLPPTIVINGVRLPKNNSTQDVHYEGQVGDTASIECISQESYGTVHLERCTTQPIWTCSSTEKVSGRIPPENITLHAEKNHTSYQCVYTNQFGGVKSGALVTIKTIKPPKLSSSKHELKPYSTRNTTSHTFTLHGKTGDIIKVECKREEPSGFLHWRNCSSHDNCSPTQYIRNQSIIYTKILKSESNGAKLYCDYLSLHGTKFSSSIVFVVEPDAVKIAKTSPRGADKASIDLTVEPSNFQYDDELKFTCTTEDKERYAKIFLVLPDGNITVPAPEEKFSEKIYVYTGRYRMNFTQDVTAKCELYPKGGSVGRIQGAKEKILIFTKKYDSENSHTGTAAKASNEDDPGKSGNTLIWGCVGTGICIVAILIFAVVKVCKAQKQEIMKERTSVTYENFNNDRQTPTPPFPRGAKLEETYLTPADCKESPYAITKMADTDTYAQPYIPNTIEELYSKPVPKNQRRDNFYSNVFPKNQIPKNDDINYAEITAKTKTKRNVIKEVDNYASIVSSDSLTDQKYENVEKAAASLAKAAKNKREENYVNGKGQNYTNVYLNEPYVNVRNSSSEYAEPSYCELGRKH